MADIPSDTETDHLLGPGSRLVNPTDTRDLLPVAYKRRWYMLLVFSVLACVQGALNNVWLVVAQSSEAAFNWSNSDLSLMQLFTYLTYVVAMAPFGWLMQNKGMRVSTLTAAILVFLGTVFRVISSKPPVVTWMANLGHIMNGLAGPGLFSGSAVISATWFPADQRATATAVGVAFGVGGTAVIFLVDPYLVPSPVQQSGKHLEEILNGTNVLMFQNVDEIRKALLILRFIELAVAGLLLLMILSYFPSKPPSAPSVSATTDKLAFLTGLSRIFSSRKLNFWYVAIPSAISAGLLGVFMSVLDVNLKEIGVSQTSAGWLNFYSTVASCVTGILVGKLGDKFVGKRKMILLIMATAAVLSAFGFLLIVAQYVAYNEFWLYASYILLAVAVNGALPLYYEASIETTFPVSEDVTMGVITTIYNVLPMIFLIVFLFPSIGTEWMNWFMYVSLVICIPFLLVFRERYDRLSLDDSALEN